MMGPLRPQRKVPLPTLSNSPNYIERYWEYQKYLRHRKYIANAQPRVDNKAPKLNCHMYMKLADLLQDNQRVLKIQRENKQLLHKINSINRTKGHLNTFWDHQQITCSKYIERMKEAEKIAYRNRIIHRRIKRCAPIYSNKKLQKEWAVTEKLLMHVSRYPPTCPCPSGNKVLPQNHWKEFHALSLQTTELPIKHIKCYFDLSVKDGEPLGRLVFIIYADVVPKTAFNFLAICKGIGGLTYQGCRIHRIVPGLMCQGGDITRANGSGGLSVYGKYFPDENFSLTHGSRGVLSMANKGPNTNNSKFNIIFRPLITLDGKCVVIGKIIDGFNTLVKMEQLGTRVGKPRKIIIISKCGLLPA